MTAITDDALRGIREREQAATKRPWTNEGGEIGTDARVPPPSGHTEREPCGAVLFERDFATDADCEFIAHARADMPALLAEVERLRGEHRAALNEVQRLRECADAALARVKELETRDGGDLWLLVRRMIDEGWRHKGKGFRLNHGDTAICGEHLDQEVAELRDSINDQLPRHIVAKEIGDVLGILMHLAKLYGYEWSEIERIEISKLHERFAPFSDTQLKAAP